MKHFPRGPRWAALTATATVMCLWLSGCDRARDDRQPTQPPAAAASVQAVHAQFIGQHDVLRPEAMADARRGFIAAPTGQVKNDRGEVVWDFDSFAFVKEGPAPATVHPGLWRQAILNNQIGLFKVRDGIWQLRGFDLANMTLIQGKTGWIVVDALTSRETAAHALAFARRHLGEVPVSAVILTHSHVDHFGGVLALLSGDQIRSRSVPIVAPAGFLEEATSENVLMGTAMSRRAMFMYGGRLEKSPTGLVDNGLGKAVAQGQVGIVEPTVLIDRPEMQQVIDGVTFVFRNVPGAEAPAELTFTIPALKAYCGGEMLSHTLHNLYTLRGAKVRDALTWSRFIGEALDHAEGAEVYFGQHHWPVWGQDRIRDFITHQRDAYRYIHDQTVRLINAGMVPGEIAETLTLPPSLDRHLSIHGYYGTVRHNVKGVYQQYMGWFDGHPSNLDPHPPREVARRYVALAGGIEAAVKVAHQALDAGDARWAAELLKHVVFVEPDHAQARSLLARSFEQLGQAAEAAPWRNFYLTGAHELRHGEPAQGFSRADALDLMRHTPIERLLDAMAANVNGPKAAELTLKINLNFTDLGRNHVLWLENGVLHHRQAARDAQAQATLNLTHAFFLRMIAGDAGAKDLLLSPDTRIEGSRIDLGRFFALIDKPKGTFPIVVRPH